MKTNKLNQVEGIFFFLFIACLVYVLYLLRNSGDFLTKDLILAVTILSLGGVMSLFFCLNLICLELHSKQIEKFFNELIEENKKAALLQ